MIYRHAVLPIAAPEMYWTALGYRVCLGTDVVDKPFLPADEEKILILALGACPNATGETVLAWALREAQRRKEESERVRGQHHEANAIKELAKAISGSAEDVVLQNILRRLTDRTQYAVKAQLGKV